MNKYLDIYPQVGDIIYIGKAGEKNATRVLFDITEWVHTFGKKPIITEENEEKEVLKGKVELLIEKDGTTGMVDTSYAGDISSGPYYLSWVVDNNITTYPGVGKAQMLYRLGDDNNKVIAKSNIFNFIVTNSLASGDEIPPGESSWVEKVLDAAALAQAYGTGKKGKGKDEIPLEEGDIGYHNNSPYWSQVSNAYANGFKNGSQVIEGEEGYQNNAKYWSQVAQANANGTIGDQISKDKESEYATNNAEYFKRLAYNEADRAEAFAKGTKSGSEVIEGEGFQDNAKYYKDLTHAMTFGDGKEYKNNNAQYFYDQSLINSNLSESYAKGTINGEKVTSDKEGYENNAKYWSQIARANTDGTIGDQISDGAPYNNNNTKYYKDLTHAITFGDSGEYKDNNAQYFYNQSLTESNLSESYAKGTIKGEKVTSDKEGYEDNAKYYKDLTHAMTFGDNDKNKTNNAKYFYDQSLINSNLSEVYAKGTIKGEKVTIGEEGYEDNAKHYKDLALHLKQDTELWAKGTIDGKAAVEGEEGYQDNGKYYYEEATKTITTVRGDAGKAEAARVAAVEAQKKAEAAANDAVAGGIPQKDKPTEIKINLLIGEGKWNKEVDSEYYIQTISNELIEATGYGYLISPSLLSSTLYSEYGIGARDVTENNVIVFQAKELPKEEISVSVIKFGMK